MGFHYFTPRSLSLSIPEALQSFALNFHCRPHRLWIIVTFILSYRLICQFVSFPVLGVENYSFTRSHRYP
jgi:hypothetical protein